MVNQFVLRSYIPQLIKLAGEARWKKRVDGLKEEAQKSAALARIVSDYHWIECVLDDEARARDPEGMAFRGTWGAAESAQTLRALRFARNVVEFHGRLTDVGRKSMQGRLRDALKAPTGFLPLAQELEFAAFGVASALHTSLPDMSGTGREDACFEGLDGQWYLECKFLSADAGRKVTRRDFYRLFALVEADLQRFAQATGAFVAIVVSLDDRLEAGRHLHGDLPATIKRFCVDPAQPQQSMGFRIEMDGLQGITAIYGSEEFYSELRSRFGVSAHACGAVLASGAGAILIVRSEKEDDVSKPILDAITDAAGQLPKGGHGVISLHLQGITTNDLTLPHLQRRLLLLTNYFFHSRSQVHVSSVHVTAAGDISIPEDLDFYHALSLHNPTCDVDCEAKTFASFSGNSRIRIIRRPWALAAER